MNIELLVRLRRAVRIVYSRDPAARRFRAWRYFTTDPSGGAEYGAADILLLPLAGLALTLWLIDTVPGAGEAISMACSIECVP